MDSPDALCDLAEVFTTTGVRQAVMDYLGERPAMIANKWIMRRSPTGVVLGDFHQDGAFLGEGIRTVDCWIALSHCGPGTGKPAVDFVPRRLDAVLPSGEGATFTWSLAEQTVRDAVPDADVISPGLRARRRVVLRRAAAAPHQRRDRPDDPLRDRVVVRRAVVVPGQASAGRAVGQ